MKKLIPIIIPIIAAGIFLLLSGCATDGGVQQYFTPANARIATAIVCSNTLNFAVQDQDRVGVANYIYAIAHGIRTLSGGKAPTPQDLQTIVNLFSPGNGKWISLGTSISGVYGGIYAQIKGNPKLALEYLEAIAAGCEDAAAPYITVTPTPTP